MAWAVNKFAGNLVRECAVTLNDYDRQLRRYESLPEFRRFAIAEEPFVER